MNNDRENMSKSEMSLRKFLKNLGVTSHKIIEEKLNSSLKKFLPSNTFCLLTGLSESFGRSCHLGNSIFLTHT